MNTYTSGADCRVGLFEGGGSFSSWVEQNRKGLLNAS